VKWCIVAFSLRCSLPSSAQVCAQRSPCNAAKYMVHLEGKLCVRVWLASQTQALASFDAAGVCVAVRIYEPCS
jgi:hypothetical protein